VEVVSAETCATCTFWLGNPAGEFEGKGDCRLVPPKIIGPLIEPGAEADQAIAWSSRFPVSSADSWCAMWKPDLDRMNAVGQVSESNVTQIGLKTEDRYRRALEYIADYWGAPMKLGTPSDLLLHKWMDDLTTLQNIAAEALGRDERRGLKGGWHGYIAKPGEDVLA
jgi:hypothetical protein